ncbi:MAG: 30S ribosome-binding factor RbfA [Armatimonadetes bacterium]|nr:30S ribosome-binding factor RbfA [Armatimonadota bacterium]
MSIQRLAKIKELIKQEISLIIPQLKDPRLHLCFITVTDAEVSPDLKYAKIFVSILGEEDKKKKILEGLSSACGYIRGELAKRISLRNIPQIVFKFDSSIERGSRIFELLAQVKDENKEP